MPFAWFLALALALNLALLFAEAPGRSGSSFATPIGLVNLAAPLAA